MFSQEIPGSSVEVSRNAGDQGWFIAGIALQHCLERPPSQFAILLMG